jgi:hypothetical protein
MVNAIALVCLPSQISDASAKVDLNFKLFTTTDRLVKSSEQASIQETLRRVRENIVDLDQLAGACRTEPAKLAMVRQVQELGRQTLKSSQELHGSMESGLKQFFLSGSRAGFETPYLKCIHLWGQGAVLCSQVESVAYNDLIQQQARLQICARLYILFWLSGAVISAWLGVLIARRLIARVRG